jgi:hypothetical protein
MVGRVMVQTSSVCRRSAHATAPHAGTGATPAQSPPGPSCQPPGPPDYHLAPPCRLPKLPYCRTCDAGRLTTARLLPDCSLRRPEPILLITSPEEPLLSRCTVLLLAVSRCPDRQPPGQVRRRMISTKTLISLQQTATVVLALIKRRFHTPTYRVNI